MGLLAHADVLLDQHLALFAAFLDSLLARADDLIEELANLVSNVLDLFGGADKVTAFHRETLTEVFVPVPDGVGFTAALQLAILPVTPG